MKRALALASNVVRGKHTTSASGELREAARSQRKLPQKNIQRKKGSVSKATNTKPGRAPYIPTCHLNLAPQPSKTQPHELWIAIVQALRILTHDPQAIGQKDYWKDAGHSKACDQSKMFTLPVAKDLWKDLQQRQLVQGNRMGLHSKIDRQNRGSYYIWVFLMYLVTKVRYLCASVQNLHLLWYSPRFARPVMSASRKDVFHIETEWSVMPSRW